MEISSLSLEAEFSLLSSQLSTLNKFHFQHLCITDGLINACQLTVIIIDDAVSSITNSTRRKKLLM